VKGVRLNKKKLIIIQYKKIMGKRKLQSLLDKKKAC
jgi:hypothetical protein